MDLGQALNILRAGKRATRPGWNGKGMSLELQVPDENSKMTLPYIFMHTAQGDRVPWLASQTDILATDWGLFVASEPAPQSPVEAKAEPVTAT